MSMIAMFANAAVVIFALLLGFLLIPDTKITGDKIVLGDEKYAWRIVNAPVATGLILDKLSIFLTASRFGPALRRLLLNSNQIHMLRELASQIDILPMYFPVRRVGKFERAEMGFRASRDESSLSTALSSRVALTATQTSCHHNRTTVLEYHKMYLAGVAKPSEVMKNTLEVVHDWKRQGFNVFSSFNAADIMEQAYESDKRYASLQPISVFDGVPVAFKDMLDVLGQKIYNGRDSSDERNVVTPTKDDTLVKRFRDVGAIIFGTTLMTEGGVTPLGFNAHFQGPQSAFSPSRYSGGSSSGSGVAVATGLVPVAIGFDGGGSIRVPASMSGVHGLATTFSRCPFDNNTMSTLTKTGPLAATAHDAALAFAVMAPAKPGHFYSILYDGDVQGPPDPHLMNFGKISDLVDVKIGIFSEWFNDSNPDIREACKKAVEYLEHRGATVVNVSIPHLPSLSLAHGIKIASEFALGFDQQAGTRPETLEPNTRITLGIGGTVSAAEVLAAEKLRAWAFQHVQGLFDEYKLAAIVTPTIPVPPPPLTAAARTHGESNTGLVMQVMKYVFLANLLGMPGYSVPVGFTRVEEPSAATGFVDLPVGLHLLGNHWHEDELLRLAHSIEQGYTCRIHHPQLQFQHRPFGKFV